MKHTPGPWKFTPIPEYKTGGIACEIMENSRFGERVVARVYAWGTPAKNGAPLTEQEKKNRMEEGHANAYLVSAAPELLAMLERLWSDPDIQSCGHRVYNEEITNLIKKAKGE